MELHQLEYLVAVAEEGSFTRAATRLRVSQPGVSTQVRRLEHELGQALLDRTGRGVTVSDAGAAVLPHARAALAAVAAVRQTADQLAGVLRGRVRIGHAAGAALDAEERVVRILVAFHREHPGVDVALVEYQAEPMLAALRDGEIDLALTSVLPGTPPPWLARRTLVDVALVAVVTADHPLLAAVTDGGTPLTELAGTPIITMPRGSGLRERLDDAFVCAGSTPRIAFETTAHTLAVQLAAHGLGAAVVPDRVAQVLAGPGLRILRLTGPEPRSMIALGWRAGGPIGPAARTLLDQLLQPAR